MISPATYSYKFIIYNLKTKTTFLSNRYTQIHSETNNKPIIKTKVYLEWDLNNRPPKI